MESVNDTDRMERQIESGEILEAHRERQRGQTCQVRNCNLVFVLMHIMCHSCRLMWTFRTPWHMLSLYAKARKFGPKESRLFWSAAMDPVLATLFAHTYLPHFF